MSRQPLRTTFSSAASSSASSSLEQKSSYSSCSVRITPSRQSPSSTMAQQEEAQEASYSAAEPFPMRRKRIEEKEALAHLNDRLLEYIQKVRNMKDVNAQLEREVTRLREQLGKEAESIKQLYEAELADARSLIDETAKDKATVQIENSKLLARIEELKAEMKEMMSKLEGLETKVTMAERAAAASEAQKASILEEKAKFQRKAKDLEKEIASLQAQIATLRESMEAETLSKVDLQNNIQSLKEELAFRKKVYEEEVASLQGKIEDLQQEVIGVNVQYRSRLDIALDELREKSETEIAQFKLEIEATYKDKIALLESQSDKDAATITRMNSDLHSNSAFVTEANSEISRLQRANEKLGNQLRGKEEEMMSLRQSQTDEVARLVAELRQLRESYEVKIKEYEALMDIRIQLDHEISTYRALLQEEESRLNIPVTPPREKRRQQRIPASEPIPKRPRLHERHQQEEQSFTSTSSAGFIQICDVDPTGKFVKIKNMSSQIESLGKFKIQHEVEGSGEAIAFRFHTKSKLQGGHSVTVWSQKAEGAIHSPPDNIIWKGADNWGCGEKTITKLISPAGDVVATFSQRSEVKVTPVKSKPMASPSSLADASSRSYPNLPDSG